MNSADGLAPQALTDDGQAELLSKVRDIWDQLRGPNGAGWPQLGQNSEFQNLTPVDAITAIKEGVESVLPSTSSAPSTSEVDS
jgi:hypothetical protein